MVRTEDLDEIVARLVERIEGRYYGKYRGIVTDNQDPDNLGRIRVKVPRLLADVEIGWALPCVPYGGTSEQGLFAVPDSNASVWIEFESGDLAYPIWCGTWWGDSEVPESATPDQKVLKTSSGHKIVLDDNAGSVLVQDSNENKVTLDSNGIKLEDSNGNSVTMDSSGVTVSSSQINIGGSATDNLVAFNMLNTALTQFATMVQSHTHVGNLGAPTGPPVPPPTLTIDSAKSHHQLEL
jgi:uncharacterized protein involved in type VI secretion and phage assembly